MRNAILLLALASCSKSEPTASASTVENGVRVNYVAEPASCSTTGDQADFCVMEKVERSGVVSRDAWACSSAVSKTSGKRENACMVTLAKCQEMHAAVKEAIETTPNDPDVADMSDLRECEIYRVKK